MKYLAVVGALAACGSNPQPPSQPHVSPAQPPAQRATVEAASDTPSAASPSTSSEPDPVQVRVVAVDAVPVVRLVRNALVRAEPDGGAPDIGTIARNARAAVVGEAPAGTGCATRWLRIAPRGWICDAVTVPTHLPPSVAVSTSIADEDPTPPVKGVYGIVRKEASAFESVDAIATGEGEALVGNNSVRAVGSVRLDGKRYWRTSGGQLIDAESIVGMSPSRFRGVRIDDPGKMPAWIRSASAPILGRSRPHRGARVVRKLAPRTAIEVIAVSDDGRFVEIEDRIWIDNPGSAGVRSTPGKGVRSWIARRDVRIAQRTDAPEGIGDDEKWFDVDLDAQVLVAYEGSRPVYATMVSTGRWGHATPEIVTRIAHKLQVTTMSSNQSDVYSVADVPWTMFYDRDYALHAAYWHNGFGTPRSHGCVNLAPFDARLLFRWSSPDVPPGWLAVRGDVDHPGSLVRIRSHRVPEPNVRGYARDVRGYAREARPRATTDG